jgi:hypothetical protein
MRARLLATLEVHLSLLEKQAERLVSIAQHIVEPNAKQECLELAREAEDEAHSARKQIAELERED